MDTSHQPPLEAEILFEALARGQPFLDAEAADVVLNCRFTDRQRERMLQLTEQGSRGTLTPLEREEMLRYVRVGDLLSILHVYAQTARDRFARSA